MYSDHDYNHGPHGGDFGHGGHGALHKLHLQMEMCSIKQRLLVIRQHEGGEAASPAIEGKLRKLAVRSAVLSQRAAKLHYALHEHHYHQHRGHGHHGHHGRGGHGHGHRHGPRKFRKFLTHEIRTDPTTLVVVDTRFLTQGGGAADAEARADAIVQFMAALGIRHVLVAKPGSPLLKEKMETDGDGELAASIQPATSGCIGKSILKLLEHELEDEGMAEGKVEGEGAEGKGADAEGKGAADAKGKGAADADANAADAADTAEAATKKNIVLVTGRPQLMRKAVLMGARRGLRVMRGKALMRCVHGALGGKRAAAADEAGVDGGDAAEVPELVPVVLPVAFPVGNAAAKAAAAAEHLDGDDATSESDSDSDEEEAAVGAEVAELMTELALDEAEEEADEGADEDHDLALALAMQHEVEGGYDMLDGEDF